MEKLHTLLATEDGKDFERVGFLQVRLGEAKKRSTYKKPIRKKDGDKNLRYADCSEEMQKGLRKSRATEWQKWRKFNAGVLLSHDEVETMRADGVEILPMQWVETDKNAHKRKTAGKQGYIEVPAPVS